MFTTRSSRSSPDTLRAMQHPAFSTLRPPIASETLSRAVDVIKCLGHPLRLRLLESLEDGERTVTELQEHAGAEQAAVSQQLAALKARGIVAARREGVRVFYRIVEPKVHSLLTCIRARDLDR